MKYCVYCGNKVDEKNDICPYCKRSIAEEKTNCIPHVNIKCVKCGSSNINYQIKEKNIDDVTFEDIEYTCQDCKKKFNDFDRLGPSFNNKYQLIFSRAEKKAIKWLIIFIVAIVIIAYKSISRIYEEINWELMDCSGLPKMSFIQIKEGAPDNDYKYKGNSYIFTTTIYEIKGNEIITPIEENDYTGSYIKVNKAEIKKLSNYKKGDSITFCGTVRKISLYHKVYVDNATIIK